MMDEVLKNLRSRQDDITAELEILKTKLTHSLMSSILEKNILNKNHIEELESLVQDLGIPLTQTSKQIDVGSTIKGTPSVELADDMANDTEFGIDLMLSPMPMDCDVPEAFCTMFDVLETPHQQTSQQIPVINDTIGCDPPVAAAETNSQSYLLANAPESAYDLTDINSDLRTIDAHAHAHAQGAGESFSTNLQRDTNSYVAAVNGGVVDPETDDAGVPTCTGTGVVDNTQYGDMVDSDPGKAGDAIQKLTAFSATLSRKAALGERLESPKDAPFGYVTQTESAKIVRNDYCMAEAAKHNADSSVSDNKGPDIVSDSDSNMILSDHNFGGHPKKKRKKKKIRLSFPIMGENSFLQVERNLATNRYICCFNDCVDNLSPNKKIKMNEEGVTAQTLKGHLQYYHNLQLDLRYKRCTKVNPITCPYCNKKYTKMQGLNNHLNICSMKLHRESIQKEENAFVNLSREEVEEFAININE